MTDAPRTWHHGLVSEWWANFNVDGPEIEYFQRFVERGTPALDAGCGAGRLLLPWLRAGLDVDGCDASADMIARCRERAAAEGFDPTLLVQPLHELDPPRRYRTIVACGVFGLGTTRAQDEEGLLRLRAALEPGGTLLLDNEVPYSSPRRLRRWTVEGRSELPAPWPEEWDRRTAADGSEYALQSRMLAADPLDQSFLLAIRAEKRVDGEVVAAEEHTLTMRTCFRDEIVLMLERAGFPDVDVRGEYTDAPPTPDDHTLVFVARA
jgi:SAM-dependent methyltransferase